MKTGTGNHRSSFPQAVFVLKRPIKFRKRVLKSLCLCLSLVTIFGGNIPFALAAEPTRPTPSTPAPAAPTQVAPSIPSSPIIYLKDIDGKKENRTDSVVRKSAPEDIFIVQLKQDADKEKFESMVKEVHGKVIDTLKGGPNFELMIVQSEPGRALETAKKLSSSKEVSIVQRNQAYRLNQVPNDISFSTEWDLSFMNYTQARSIGLGKNGPMTMYFLDTGIWPVSYEVGQVVQQYNFSGPFHPTGRHENPHDTGFHGSCTCTVACTTDNTYGFAGMANFEQNRCNIVECRVSQDGESAYTVDFYYALMFISQQIALHIMAPGPVNISFGAPPPNTLNADPIMQSLAHVLLEQGSIVVFASGNDGGVDTSPELYARRIAAIQQDGTLASFSDTGPFFTAAPGVSVPCYFPYLLYPVAVFASGTSFAAPRWCAAIVDVMAALPPGRRSCALADSIVFSTAIVNAQGYHIPNLQAALQAATKY